MENYIIKMPNRYYQGPDVTKNIGIYTRYLSTKALVVITMNGYNRYKHVLDSLILDNCSVSYYFYNSDIEFNLRERPTFVIGIGGGSVIDEAKRISDTCNVPCVAIPTVLSSDAACNSIIVPKDYENKDTMIIRANRNPEVVLADTSLLSESPIHYAISGIGDALSTYYEAISSYNSTGYTMTHGKTPEFMISFARSMLDRLFSNAYDAIDYMKTKEPNKLQSFNQLVSIILYESSVLSENCGISIPHAFSLAVDEVMKDNDFLHGNKVSLGVLLLLSFMKDDGELIKVLRFMKAIGLPCSTKELGIKDYNLIMNICESVSSNKLSYNVTGDSISPVDLYNHVIRVDSLSNSTNKG